MRINKRWLWIIALCLIILLCIYVNHQNTEKDVKVFSSNKNIKIYEGNCIFKEIMKDTNLDNLVYIKNHNKINIAFSKNHYDDVKVTEYILDSNGGYKYSTNQNAKEQELEEKGNTIIFEIKPNYITMFSSNGKDYDKGKTIKGYNLECKKNGTIINYSFIIKGDAAIINKSSEK